MILAPIRASTTPEVEEDGKTLTRMTFKVVNHESHILAKDRKFEHPSGEVDDIEVLSIAAKASLKDKTNRVDVETNSGTTKTCNQMEGLCILRGGGTHWTSEALGDERFKHGSMFEAEIGEPRHDFHPRGAIRGRAQRGTRRVHSATSKRRNFCVLAPI